MRRISALIVLALMVAGCSGKSPGEAGSGPTGDFVLQVADTLATGRIELQGAYLRGAGGYSQALGNGTVFALTGAGGNLSEAGTVPAGDYDRLQLSFASVESGGRKAEMTQSGIEVAVNLTVTDGGSTSVGLAFSWADSFFPSATGLAFTPFLSRLTVTVDGTETLRLEAAEIATGSGKPPVARMRIFDATGLEAFASTFVADSPENSVIASAGNLTFTATQSEALQPGTSIAKYSWDIDGTTLTGNTVKWTSPVNGGNKTVRLTVEDSDGNKDTQTVSLALKPGVASETLTFTGDATGAGSCTPSAGGAPSTCPPTYDPVEHLFMVNTTTYKGALANLTNVRVVLSPSDATVPLADLDIALDDAAGKRLGSQTGQGSQHTINVNDPVATEGEWKVLVIGDPAYGAGYTVTVTLTWKGYNPGMEAFLASYDDGHSHEH